MRRDAFAAGFLALLALGLVAAALSVVGGPGQGQLERRNDARAEDLNDLRRCLSDATADVLTSLPSGQLANPLPCGRNLTLEDPFRQTPYAFRKGINGRFEVCAVFEKSPVLPGMFSGPDFNPESGCLSFPPDAS